MQIMRNPEREQYLFDQIRKSFAAEDKERNKNIHLSDLLTPRQAYWKRILPLPLEQREIQYFIIGRGHEDVMHRVTGMRHVDGKVWEDIHYSMDFFEPAMSGMPHPTEMKTRRGYLAKEGEELERYSHYLRQLLGYAACEGMLTGELWIWSLVEKTDAYRSEPQLACYDVNFAEEELETERGRLRNIRKLLQEALICYTWPDLPLCDDWMCRSTITTMKEKPLCLTCGREFETNFGAMKHPEGKKTLGHEIKRAVYEKHYQPKCKWYSWCRP